MPTGKICLRLWTTEISIFGLKENIEDYKDTFTVSDDSVFTIISDSK